MQVLRVAILAISNLAKNPKVDIAADLVEAGLPRVIGHRKQQVRPHSECVQSCEILPPMLHLCRCMGSLASSRAIFSKLISTHRPAQVSM